MFGTRGMVTKVPEQSIRLTMMSRNCQHSSCGPLVVCLGNIVADHIFWVRDIPVPPSKTVARTYHSGLGGLAANAAIAVVRLGGRAQFWGRVGDDSEGLRLATALAAEGVGTAQLRIVTGARTPVAAVLVDPTGERSIFSFRGSGLALPPDWLPLQDLDGARALLCDPRWPEGAAHALKAAKDRGVPTIMDAERSETRILHQLVPMVDHAIFSTPGLQNFAPGVSLVEGLRRALAVGPCVAAVTRGEKGTLRLTRDDLGLRTTPAFPVSATNTTGAGDVFHGAYALAIAEGRTVAAAMRFASAAGALRAKHGETPHRAAVDALAGLTGSAASQSTPYPS